MPAAKVLIIGAGPAGLALSHAAPDSAVILERSDGVGGLCRSMEIGDGVFDIGGHSFHSPHPEVVELVRRLMQGRWHTQRRDARVAFKGSLIDYPFQDHFSQISDPAVVAECLERPAAARAAAGAANFEEWIVQRFGAGVARYFMLPYNRKLWARDLREMSCEWVTERVAGAEPGPARGPPRRTPLMRQSQVGYPAYGGFGEIFRTLAKGCGPIEFGREVCSVDPIGKSVRTSDGAVWHWERLVSTMPAPLLLRAIAGCPADLVADADRLEHVSLKILLVLIARPLGDQPQRIYVADADVPPHKIAFNHTSSPSLRRRPAHAIMCEIAHSPYKPAPSDDALRRMTVDWLVDMDLIDRRGDVAETRIVDVKYAYPVYTRERAAIVTRLRRYLACLDIHSIGRFGGWEYLNSDACMLQGMSLAATLATGPGPHDQPPVRAAD